MPEKKVFYQNPLLKLAIPLMAGIVVGWVSGADAVYALALSALALVAVLLGSLRHAPKWLFGVGIMVLMFSIGLYTEHRQGVEKAPRWSEGKYDCQAQLLEVPAVRGTNVKVLAELSLNDTVSRGRKEGLVYLYFPRTVETELLAAGDVIAFKSYVSSPKNQGNPEEFDIESHYYIKNISGTAFVPEGKWRLLSVERKTIQMHALELRAKAIGLYKRLGFEDEALALLSALTLGEKRDFPEELKENYSVAGASHILALSGLHLGILYMLLAFLLPTAGRRFVLRLLREAMILAVMWGFAFVSGLSSSVVRAAILFTLISFGRLLDQEISPVSSLSFAAIVMLLFSPHLLFDVSFQLSFAAVMSILMLAPHLQQFLGVYKHGVLYGYFMNLLILSVAAQIGTLPFVWYHFGVFPMYFLLTNLLVVPLAFVLMLLAVAVLLLSPILLLSKLAAFPLGWVVDFMNWVVKSVAALPGASFALPPLGVFGIVCLTLLIVLFLYSLIQKRWWLLVYSVATAIVLATVYFFVNRPQDEGDYMVIYNNYKNPLLHVVFGGGENYLVSTVPQLDAEYEYVSKPFVKSKALASPVWVEWSYNDSLLRYDEGVFEFNGLTVRLLDNPCWCENEKTEPVDILVLCRGFLGRISDLVEVYPASCVVLDGSLYRRSRERIIREYAKLGIEVVDITQTGAMKVVATADGFDMIPMRRK